MTEMISIWRTLEEQRVKRVFDFVENHLRQNGCRIQTFVSGKQIQYVVKKGPYNVSISFSSLYDLVLWVSENLSKLEEASDLTNN